MEVIYANNAFRWVYIHHPLMNSSMMTINISMPKGLYAEAKKKAKKYHYASVSEVIRNALRWWLSDNLTVNGFTPEFEEWILKAEKEADKGNVIVWDGKGSFGDFVLREGKKKWGKNDKSKSRGKLLPRTEKAHRAGSEMERYSGAAAAVV
ncbi:MAG: Uncharacterized protein G01um101416_1025 [Microgenomates group bacterium Gr01-1014_16]|nr:MAG: Uncharacterized protein G01um101416_1025 [Microgenomates group bacterium Gr01-1014_16]